MGVTGAAEWEALLPAGVCGVATDGVDPADVADVMAPGEAAAVHGAAPRRRREFAAGRRCGREALARLGWPGRPIPVGDHRAPQWPPGVVGSITHCDGFCAAAVARVTEVAALGIDAERNRPMVPGFAGRIATAVELASARSVPPAAPTIAVDPALLVFSAKESVYKAWYPFTGQRLGFTECRVLFDRSATTFTATVLRAAPGVAGPVLQGRCAVTAAHVFTVAFVTAGEPDGPDRADRPG